MVSKVEALLRNLSIIFVSKDNLEDVKSTLRSIEGVLKSDVQLIVVDSSSSNQIELTIESLNCEAEVIYKWQSAQGIYPAMNEAIRLSKDGNLLWFLNPGDVLKNHKVLGILRSRIDKAGNDWGFAQAIADYPLFAEPFPKTSDPISAVELLIGRLRISHQSMFISKESLQAIGNFDTSYKIAADFQMQYRLLSYSSPIFVDDLMIQFDTTGISHDRTMLTFFESTRIRINSNEIPYWKIFTISYRIFIRRFIGFIRNRIAGD